MPYSLVSAATLGFDLVRLPAGGQVADVLLTGLGADADMLGRLAAGGVPQLRDVPAAVAGADVRTARLVTLLEQGTIGDTPSLERLVREDVLGGEHGLAGSLDPDLVGHAADVLADAATGWWAAERLDPRARRELTAPFAAATALVTPPRPELDPAGAGVDELLGAVRELDDAGRRRWRVAVDAVRTRRRPWAAAMHGASWAAHVSGRTRTLAATQLMAVQAFTDGGFTARDGAEGVWNALAGCVQGLAMADLLDDESLAVLGEPWVLSTGRTLPRAG